MSRAAQGYFRVAQADAARGAAAAATGRVEEEEEANALDERRRARAGRSAPGREGTIGAGSPMVLENGRSSPDTVVEVSGLSKSYPYHQKAPGIRGSLGSLFRRRTLQRRRRGGADLPHRAGGGGRLPGPQRGGQDDHPQAPLRPAVPQRGPGHRAWPHPVPAGARLSAPHRPGDGAQGAAVAGPPGDGDAPGAQGDLRPPGERPSGAPWRSCPDCSRCRTCCTSRCASSPWGSG